MVYKCRECGHLFEEGEEAIWYDGHGFDFPPYEKNIGCPVCKGGFVRVKPCRICFEYTEKTYCDECAEDVRSRFEKLISDNFSAEERDLLNELYDGKEI